MSRTYHHILFGTHKVPKIDKEHNWPWQVSPRLDSRRKRNYN